MKTVFDASGDIRSVDLLAALVTIWRGAQSGSVRFTRSGSSAGFDFAEGEIVAAFSSDARFETGAILVRAGKLDGAALEKLSVPPGEDGALAALQAGILTRREWKWGEKIRAIEILAELLGWPDGKYLFDPDARPSRSDFSLGIPRLLLELFLRSRDRHLVDHQLGPTHVPLRRSPNFDAEFATFGLTADAESVVHLIDGQASAADICDRAPAEEFAVLKLLAALKTLGLLAGEEEAVPTPVPAPPLPPLAELSVAEPEPIPALEEEEPLHEEESEDEFASLPEVDRALSPAAYEPLNAEEEPPPPDLAPPEREEPTPALDAEVGEAAPRWEGEPVDKEWRTSADDLDRELDTTVESQSSGMAPRSKALLWVLLAVLAAAVAGTVLVRSRGASRGTQTASIPSTPRPARSSPASSPTAAPIALPASPVPPSASPVPTSTRAPSRAATPRPGKPTPAPAPAAASGRSEPGREEWLARARADKRKLDADHRTRYSIQLELACEVPSLVEAWKHDRPTGSMWLLTVSRGGRDCFRVLWGRFPTLEAARKGKGGAPAFFSTSTNHPAVVAVR